MSKVTKTHILIIEDNPGDVDLIKQYLKEGSIKDEVIHAPTFFDGMERIATSKLNIKHHCEAIHHGKTKGKYNVSDTNSHEHCSPTWIKGLLQGNGFFIR